MNIIIIAKRWFEKVNGNTYHSVRVIVDGKEIGFIPFQYGYGDQYKSTAFELLQKAGYFTSNDYHDFINWMYDNRDNVLIYVNDVMRKKDLQ